jgi:hypothetical protein
VPGCRRERMVQVLTIAPLHDERSSAASWMRAAMRINRRLNYRPRSAFDVLRDMSATSRVEHWRLVPSGFPVATTDALSRAERPMREAQRAQTISPRRLLNSFAPASTSVRCRSESF